MEGEGFEEAREQFMTDQISRIKPDMHIGGVAHMFAGFSDALPVTPLYQRLGALVAKRIRLCEAYSIND